jgi:hypothetical protein
VIVPAKRHGRAGKKGRPKLDDSPFAEIANDESAHPAMRKIAGEASRRRLSRAELAGMIKRQPEALMRSFYADAPRLATVELICERMRLGRRVARSLLHKLTELDELTLRLEALETVSRRGALFKNHVELRWKLEEVLSHTSPKRLSEALTAYDTAHAGLISDEVLLRTAMAPELFALCEALKFDLAYYLDPKAALDVKSLEGAAALQWLLEVVPFSVEVHGVIEAFAREHGIDNQLAYRGARTALSRAQSQFRRAIGPEHLRAEEGR